MYYSYYIMDSEKYSEFFYTNIKLICFDRDFNFFLLVSINSIWLQKRYLYILYWLNLIDSHKNTSTRLDQLFDSTRVVRKPLEWSLYVIRVCLNIY